MKRLFLLSALLVFACTDEEGNPCIYEPTLETNAITNITGTSATLNGIISIVSENCDVPNNTEQGFVYSTEIQPTLEDTQVNVNGTNISTTIEGLTPNTTYYVRAFLTNTFGDFYGNEVSFSTLAGTLNCDGSVVPTIVYGTQEWTVENACHTFYRDGTPIPQVTDATEWSNLTTGAWCYYNNDPTKPRLYNMYAVRGVHDTDPNTPNKEFAPEGWHVPSDDEYYTLRDYLIANGYNYDGTTTGNHIAKAMASTTGWVSCDDAPEIWQDVICYNQSSNNSSGFNAFPAGARYPEGSFHDEGLYANFWTSYGYDYSISGHFVFVWHQGSNLIFTNAPNAVGFSVRFVRD
jgi:uncharacterized protein (TIGR02145 family)